MKFVVYCGGGIGEVIKIRVVSGNSDISSRSMECSLRKELGLGC